MTSARPATASAARLVDDLAAAGGAPRLTWYDGDGRVELSGAVLANWVVKTTNLLVEELDAGPGTRVLVDLPPHWRALVWTLAAWRAGATVALADHGATPGGRAHVLVTDRPAEHAGTDRTDEAADVVAVSLAALARRFDGDLPPGAIDAAAAVMTYPDALGWVPPTDPGATALAGTDPRSPDAPDAGPSSSASADVRHDAVLAWAAEAPSPAADVPAGLRTLVVATEPRTFLRTAVGCWARGGSLVAVTPDVAALETTAPARWERIVGGERVEARVEARIDAPSGAAEAPETP